MEPMTEEQARACVELMLWVFSIARWDEYVKSRNLSEQDLEAISDFASSMAVKCSQISVYTGIRGGFGCGDSGDEEAEKASLEVKKKVRQALDY